MMLIGLLDDIALHLHVLHDEVSAIERVGHDAAHEGSGKHHRVGLLLVKEVLYGKLVGEIQLFVCAANKIVVSALFQVVPNSRAHQSVVAGNVNLVCFLKCHKHMYFFARRTTIVRATISLFNCYFIITIRK